MQTIHRRATLALGALAAAGALALPLAANADAATTTTQIRLAIPGQSEALTDSSIGFVTTTPPSQSRNDQRWVKTDVPGPGGYATYRNVQTGKCLEGRSNETFTIRTRTCDPEGDNFNQHWTRGFFNDGRLENRSVFKVLTANLTNVNHAVEFRIFLGQSAQKWFFPPKVRIPGT